VNVNSRITLCLLLVISLCSCSLRYGLIESEFKLASDSRLPKWVDIPSEYSRKDMTMTITFYTHPFYSKVKMNVNGPAPNYELVNETIGDQRYHPLTKGQPRYVYPRYIIISAKGIDEVFEHRARESVLYITDNPKIIEGINKADIN
jgi:hypothetical protein